jgi:hypothetical protein
VLKVNFRNLNVETEMRRKFGTGYVRTDDRQRRRNAPKLSTNMVTPKQDWPQVWKKSSEPPCLKQKLSMWRGKKR